MLQEIPGRLWEYVGVDIFPINNKHFLCIVDYYSKFPVMKQVELFSTDNVIQTYKIIYSGYGLPSELTEDADKNFLSEKLKKKHLQAILHISCSSIIIQPSKQQTG